MHWAGTASWIINYQRRGKNACLNYVRYCRLSPAVQPTAEDAEVLESVRAIAALLRAEGGPSSNPQSAGELARQLSALARQLAPLVPELAPGIGYTGARRSLSLFFDF